MVFYRAARNAAWSLFHGQGVAHVTSPVHRRPSCRRVVVVRRRHGRRSRGNLPRLTQGAPTGIDASWYDDHSVIGDGHLSWSSEGGTDIHTNPVTGQSSQSEPKAIGFDPTLAVSGPGGLEVCGYPSGTVGWMRAYQAAPGVVTASGSCPATEPAIWPARGWFRYIYGRHSPTDAFNRWHIMDLERFALVPLPASAGWPANWHAHGLGQPLGNVSRSRDRARTR